MNNINNKSGTIHFCESPLAINNMFAQDMKTCYISLKVRPSGDLTHRTVVSKEIVLGMLFNMWNQARAHYVSNFKVILSDAAIKRTYNQH
jgi:hypothetical protein